MNIVIHTHLFEDVSEEGEKREETLSQFPIMRRQQGKSRHAHPRKSTYGPPVVAFATTAQETRHLPGRQGSQVVSLSL